MRSTTLVLDAGSRSVRAKVVKHDQIIRSAFRPTPSTGDPHGVARHWDGSRLFAYAAEAIRGAVDGLVVDTVIVTSQRIAVVFADENIDALYAGPNIDARGFLAGIDLETAAGDDLWAVTGRHPPIIFTPARWRWFTENDESVTAETRWILPLADWFAAKLCGRVATSPSSATDTGLFDVAKREWSPRLFELAGIDIAFAPPVLESGEFLGTVTDRAAAETGLAPGTPVAAGGADSAFALEGMGVDAVGAAASVAGSTAPLEVVTDSPIVDPSRRAWTTCLTHSKRWALDVSTGEAGIAQRWLHELMGVESARRFDDIAAKTSTSNGAMFHIAAPIDFSDLELGSIGQIRFRRPIVQLGPTRAELARAFFENLAFAVRLGLEWTDELIGHGRFHLGGGLAESSVYPQILADALGETVTTHDVHVTARGAAKTARSATGHDPNNGATFAPRRVAPRANLDATYETWRDELDRLAALAPRLGQLVTQAKEPNERR